MHVPYKGRHSGEAVCGKSARTVTTAGWEAVRPPGYPLIIHSPVLLDLGYQDFVTPIDLQQRMDKLIPCQYHSPLGGTYVAMH
jgi:hypothetical protein